VDQLRAILVRTGFLFGRLRPPRPTIVLATPHADRIGGNLLWIRDALRRSHPDLAVIELARRTPRGAVQLARAAHDALRAREHHTAARISVVDGYYFPMYVARPRPGTTFVQVWHACGALKRVGFSLAGKTFGAGRRRARTADLHAHYDVCLVSAARFAPFYAEAFALPLDHFTSRVGIPRTDLFFDAERMTRTAAALRVRYAIPDGRRVLLYAPTFRGDTLTRARSPEELDLRVLHQVLGDDHVVLMRAHPHVGRWAVEDPALAGFVIDVSDHPDVNELMLVSDVLVTDYSSVLYEFALLGRPMAFVAPDHAEYEAERGFYVDYPAYVPGPVFTSSDALAAHLRSGPFDTERVRRFAADSFDVADGHATERFIADIVRPAMGMPAPERIG
jgi:CDP-ribitol ribitolphosphotransferase